MKFQKWFVGTAIMLSLPAVLPIYRKTLKPFVNQSSEAIQDTYKRFKILAVKTKHELEDIWLEAQYDQIMKNNDKKLKRSIENEPREPRDIRPI